MKDQYYIVFSSKVSAMYEGEDSVVIRNASRQTAFNNISVGIRSVIDTIFKRPLSNQEISDSILSTDGLNGLSIWYALEHKLMERGFIEYIIKDRMKEIATLKIMQSGFTFKKIDVTKKYKVSRFAYIRNDPDDHQWIVESPLSSAKVMLYEKGMELLSFFNESKSIMELFETKEITYDIAEFFVTVLFSTGVLKEIPTSREVSEKQELQYWEFHDLLFHSRSRMGRHDYPYGGTYPFKDRYAPAPSTKERMSNEVVVLYIPDLDKLLLEDIPFSRVLEQRRSIRNYSDKPITINQLGEFLYRSARVKELKKAGNKMPYDITRRPYPSGGSVYELEIYVSINYCEGINKGTYHYNPSEHSLHQVGIIPIEQQSPTITTLAGGEVPQVLITFTARFQRVNWKYQSVAYALTLKNMGALYQTMYLVATAMGLAPCGLGGGNSDLFVNEVGINYYQESPVGEFALGSVKNEHSMDNI